MRGGCFVFFLCLVLLTVLGWAVDIRPFLSHNPVCMSRVSMGWVSVEAPVGNARPGAVKQRAAISRAFFLYIVARTAEQVPLSI